MTKGIVSKINMGGEEYAIASTAYGICNTAGGIIAKVATLQDNADFSLMDGVTIYVKFTYANAISNPTLNVNNTGAKPIYKYGTTTPGNSADASWNDNSIVSFTYDGTAWIMSGGSSSSGGQTTFSSIIVGDSVLDADTSNGVVTLESGDNVDITTDTDTNKVTISVDLSKANGVYYIDTVTMYNLEYESFITRLYDKTITSEELENNISDALANNKVVAVRDVIVGSGTSEDFDNLISQYYQNGGYYNPNMGLEHPIIYYLTGIVTENLEPM